VGFLLSQKFGTSLQARQLLKTPCITHTFFVVSKTSDAIGERLPFLLLGICPSFLSGIPHQPGTPFSVCKLLKVSSIHTACLPYSQTVYPLGEPSQNFLGVLC